MHKMSKRTKKNHKNQTTLLLFFVDTRKNLKAIRGNGYRFVQTFPTETIMLVNIKKNIMLVVRSSGL